MSTSPDPIFRSIAAHRRRDVNTVPLETTDGTASLDDRTAAAVARATTHPKPDEVGVAVSLQHIHLPVLDDAGVLDDDPRTGTVQYLDSRQRDAVMDGADGDRCETRVAGLDE